MPQHFVTRLARETGTIVVQVGEGADELFHGYQGYVDHRRVVVPVPALGARGRIRRPIGAAAVRATPRAGRAASATARRSTTPATAAIPYWGGALCFRGPLKERLLRHGAPTTRCATVERDLGRGASARAATPTSSSA